VSQATGEKVLIMYNSRNRGRQTVVGPVTKQKYGYRKHGDVFEVYEADMRVRPDLYRAVQVNDVGRPVKPEGNPAVKIRQQNPRTLPDFVRRPPAPPPPPEPIVVESATVVDNPQHLANIEWEKINSNHIKLLADAGVITFDDVNARSEEELLAIKGIGPVVVKELKERARLI